MESTNTQFCRILLRTVREEAAKAKVEVPHMTAFRSSSGAERGYGFYLVEGPGVRKEVWAYNAYEAKAKVIEGLIDLAKERKESADVDRGNTMKSSVIWRDASKERPQHTRKVLTYRKQWGVGIGGYRDGNWWVEEGYAIGTLRPVLFWSELPEAPKGVK